MVKTTYITIQLPLIAQDFASKTLRLQYLTPVEGQLTPVNTHLATVLCSLATVNLRLTPQLILWKLI